MTRPILSIAIPTWNRAASLDEALKWLMPQVANHGRNIEVIVSDNCSTDNTGEVVDRWSERFPSVEIIRYRQTSNTGFYGNFRKCKELATASFLWILSDDDYVQEGVLDLIVKHLMSNSDTALVFLEGVWTKSSKPLGFSPQQEIRTILRDQSYRLTLISVVIFRNIAIDPEIFDHYKGSDFLGFILLLLSLKPEDRGVYLYGDTLSANNESHKGFDWFKAFGQDLPGAARLLLTVGLSRSEYLDFKRHVLVDLIRHYLILYKIEKRLTGDYQYTSMATIVRTITCNYADTPAFYSQILPIILAPGAVLKVVRNIKVQLKSRARTVQ